MLLVYTHKDIMQVQYTSIYPQGNTIDTISGSCIVGVYDNGLHKFN